MHSIAQQERSVKRRRAILFLRDRESGVRFLATASGAGHIVDLSRREVLRVRSRSSTVLCRDCERVTLLGPACCTLGQPMRRTIDLHVPGVTYTNRTPTTVIAIERIRL